VLIFLLLVLQDTDTSSVGFHFGGFANFEIANDFSSFNQSFVIAGGKESQSSRVFGKLILQI
jgi:hypothetical protein